MIAGRSCRNDISMEDRIAVIISISLIVLFTLTIIISRVVLKLSEPFFLICGICTAAIAAVIIVTVIRGRYHRRRKVLESKLVSEGRELRVEYSFLRKVAGVPTKFRYKELEEATDGFRSLLGKGASASVYKGILSDGTAVAVKRIEDEKGEKEFKSEVAAIASVQHVNLVRLLGYCSLPSGQRFLICDFVYNGSLDSWIFPRREFQGVNSRGGCLSWDLRCRVATDVAKALSYLHYDCRSCILHLDLKPENILLDERFCAVVADFGLSKLKGKDESRIITGIRGTRGYLAPEWILENGVSEKCDVYGYGMVLLEMIGGRRNICVIENGQGDRRQKKFQVFGKIAGERLREGKVMEILDQRLAQAGGVEEREVEKLVCIALLCLQDDPKLRPTMKAVVEMLEGRGGVDAPPDDRMIISEMLANLDEDEGNQLQLAALRMARMEAPVSASSNSYAMSSVLSGR